MDTMYEFFYLTTLVSAILLAITALTYTIKSTKRIKIRGYIFNVLAVITICSLIAFIITIP